VPSAAGGLARPGATSVEKRHSVDREPTSIGKRMAPAILRLAAAPDQLDASDLAMKVAGAP